MDKVRINIEIGGHKHPLEVNVEDEPVYREAGRMVNERLRVYATKYRGANLPPDFMMAFAAVDIAARFIRQRKDESLEAEEKALLDITDDLQKFLDNR
ncbi:MAG: cell division protein ZapA [Bacteroidales bacterium]|nr:cell division protein ZapA [Bacteroidales bacterium]